MGESNSYSSRYMSMPLPPLRSSVDTTNEENNHSSETSLPRMRSSRSRSFTEDALRELSRYASRSNLHNDPEHTPLLKTIVDDDKNLDGTTSFQSSVSIIKCVVGAGSFFLPYAFKKGGLWASIVGVFILGAMCGYSNDLVIRSKRRVYPSVPCSYVDVAKTLFGRPVGVVMYIAILISGMGACAVYLVFCGQLLESLFQIDWRWFAISMTLLEIFVSWSKSFKYLAYTSIVGDLALLLGMAVVFIYGFTEVKHIAMPIEDYPAIQIKTLPLFFGSAAFLFAIPQLVFPVENGMRNPSEFRKANIHAYIFVTLLNVMFGAYAYLVFGNDVQQIIINNLGESWYVKVAKIALVFDLFFTFVVVILPSRDILETSFFGMESELTKVVPVPHYKRMIVRAVLIMGCFGAAVSIPSVSNLADLSAGLASSFMTFMLSPAVHLKLQYNDIKSLRKEWDTGMIISFVLHTTMIVFGMFAMVLTTGEALEQTIKGFENGHS